MKTNSKLALATVIGFLVGGAAGLFFRGAEITPDLAQGDISKASKFNKNVVSPAMSAFQEKIASNPEELEKATFSLTVLTSRMTEFDELVTLAVAVSEGNEELAASIENLQNVKQLAANARTSGKQALEALNAIAEEKKSSVDYEQASQNLALAFMMVDRQISVGKQYVCDVDSFLSGKDVEDYKELALARDLWAGYCAGEAVLTNNDDELAYWSKQQNLLSSGSDVLAASQHIDISVKVALKQCLDIDSSIGLDVNNSMLSDKAQFERFDHTMDNMDVLSNNDVQSFIKSGAQGTDMIGMSEGLVNLDVNQMILNAVPDMGGKLVVAATDGPMSPTREHLLL